MTGQATGDTIMVRRETGYGYGYGRVSYELNLGCNYDCEHCYLREKAFAGMEWPGRERLLDVMAEAGVPWLQLTGGARTWLLFARRPELSDATRLPLPFCPTTNLTSTVDRYPSSASTQLRNP